MHSFFKFHHGHGHRHEYRHECGHGRGRHTFHGAEGGGETWIHADFAYGGGGGRRERKFGSGDLKLVVLHILASQPSHGYEIIKAVGELVGGGYAPSPGVVYPTLTLLEDLGFAAGAQQDGGRKEYRITPEGQAHLDQEREALDRILARMGQFRSRAHGRRFPEIVRAMENLKMALQMRMSAEEADAALARRISEIIDRTAVEIERS